MKEKTLRSFYDIIIEREVDKTKDFRSYNLLSILVTGTAMVIDMAMLLLTASDAYNGVYATIIVYFIIFCIVSESAKAIVARIWFAAHLKSIEIEELADTLVQEYRSRSEERWEIKDNILTIYYTLRNRKYTEEYDFTDVFNMRIQGVEGNVCIDRNVLRIIELDSIKDVKKRAGNFSQYEVLIPDYYEESIADGLNEAYRDYIRKLVAAGILEIEVDE